MSDKKGEENEETEKKATSSRAEPYFEDRLESRERLRERLRELLVGSTEELVGSTEEEELVGSTEESRERILQDRLEELMRLKAAEAPSKNITFIVGSTEESRERLRELLVGSTEESRELLVPSVIRASRTEVDYLNALGHGETKVAYARVMIVGPGGVGKSSLLNGLMNLPLPCEAYSTQVADTFSLRPTESYWACSQEGKFWTKITDADEIKGLAQLIQTILDYKDSNSATGSNANSGSDTSSESDVSSGEIQPSKTAPKFDHPLIEGILKEILSVITTGDPFIREEVYLHVWDCGGQPVFLKILPAFLTARTLFLLMFDARCDLHDQYQCLTYFKGRATEHLEDISTLDLMVQWISTIHATLSNKRLIIDKESDEDEEVPKYPLVLPVGSHGDDVSVKERKHEILEKLSSELTGKAFSDIVLDGAIVNNTTAGMGELEDDTFKFIRTIVSDFATEDLAIRTPITWLLFRKVFQRYTRSQKKPVVPLEEVKELCRACLIPEDTLTSILTFYHDLAVFFHYSDIPSLKSCVIADPQWLVKQIARLLALEGREEYRNSRLWKLLRKDGILVESLYQKVLRAQKKLKPQQIVDLLEHFLIIAKISTEKHKGPGLKYFVPSMLPHLPKVDDPHSTSTAINSAIPLHLVFSTNYLPPGFFTQLAAVMSKHPKCHLPVDKKMYQNQIQFLFGSPGQQLDRLFITEEKFSVRIDVQRIDSRKYKCPTFISSCHAILEIIQQSFTEIKKWLPGIGINFALKCEGCPQRDHFIILPEDATISNPTLVCEKSVRIKLNIDQNFWLSIRQEIAIVSSSELEVIAMEVQKCEKVKELAEVLEMSEHLEYINNNAKILLDLWQEEIEMVSRPHLLQHLSTIGIQDMQKKLFYHKFEQTHKEHYEQQLSLKDREIQEKNKEIDQLKKELEKECQLKKGLEKALNQLQSAPRLQPGCSPAPTQSTTLTSKPQPLGTSSAPDSEPTRKSVEASQVKDDTLSSPTMINIINFPLQDSKVNLTKEVGKKYPEFGILLLEDQTGAHISALEKELMKNAENINYQVFQEWLQGKGRQPVSWETLVSVLEDIGLNQLAKSIRDTVIRCKRSLIDEQPLTESNRHHQSSQFAHTALNQLQSVPQLQPGCSPAPTQSTPSLTSKPQPLGTSSAPDSQPTRKSVEASQVKDDTLTYRNVRTALIDIVREWRDLGAALGLPDAEVDKIRYDNPNDINGCMKDLIEQWLKMKGSQPPSWSSLCTALRDPLVNRKDIATSIEQKYCMAPLADEEQERKRAYS